MPSAKRKRASLGIPGVFARGRSFTAQGNWECDRYHLYSGPDFFEACCARKRWENHILTLERFTNAKAAKRHSHA
jgi:hypothetical protein